VRCFLSAKITLFLSLYYFYRWLLIKNQRYKDLWILYPNEFNGLAVTETMSPQLSWANAQKEPKVLLTCYDPDAPTGAGWWHWVALTFHK
jgi:hypothetical protein